MSIPFTKMQGVGNDFVVVSGEAHDWSRLAPALCDRHFGIGADGVLVALPSAHADVRMRMYNPDGTEDHCGNGLRCLAWYALDRGLVSGAEFTVETLAGVRAVRVVSQNGRSAEVIAEMGRAELTPEAIPAHAELDNLLGVPLEVAGETVLLHSLSTGTTHTVLFARPDDELFYRVSPALEQHPLFPERTSVMWSEVVTPEHVRVRIWERGAGETLACGTGACAVAVAGLLVGRTGPTVAVESAGGILHATVREDLSIQLRGPASFVFEGTWLSNELPE